MDGKVVMLYCSKCKTMKPKNEFRPGWTMCSDCTDQARIEFYNRVKSGETYKDKPSRGSKIRKKIVPDHADGAIHKRCPGCRAHVWVDQTETTMLCWKCKAKLKITKALRDSTYHRGGVILNVIK